MQFHKTKAFFSLAIFNHCIKCKFPICPSPFRASWIFRSDFAKKPRVITWFSGGNYRHMICLFRNFYLHFHGQSPPRKKRTHWCPLKVIEFLRYIFRYNFIYLALGMTCCGSWRDIDFIKQTRLLLRLAASQEKNRRRQRIQLSYQMKEEYKRRYLRNNFFSFSSSHLVDVSAHKSFNFYRLIRSVTWGASLLFIAASSSLSFKVSSFSLYGYPGKTFSSTIWAAEREKIPRDF